MTPLKFAALLTAAVLEIEHEKDKGLEKACVILETEAKRVIGTYDYGWPPLEPETIARKSTGDSPLLETGAMRDSIEHTVGHGEAWVGTNDPRAKWHELGTRTIPPRPFFAGAIYAKQEEVEKVFGNIVMKAFKNG